MQEHIFQIDIAFIINSQSDEWIQKWTMEMENAFKNNDNRLRLLANLLVMEQYTTTLRQGLAASGKTLSAGLECARNILWDFLNSRIAPLILRRLQTTIMIVCLLTMWGRLQTRQKNFMANISRDRSLTLMNY